MENKQELKAWREVNKSSKFNNAFRGIYVFIKTTSHSWFQILCLAVATTLGLYFDISSLEWVAIVFAIGIVFITEAINTAIEIDIDLTSPEYHPFAKDTKDVAAGAVLLASFMSAIVGLIIFLPKVLAVL